MILFFTKFGKFDPRLRPYRLCTTYSAAKLQQGAPFKFPTAMMDSNVSALVLVCLELVDETRMYTNKEII
jgi:hypothetical protein